MISDEKPKTTTSQAFREWPLLLSHLSGLPEFSIVLVLPAILRKTS